MAKRGIWSKRVLIRKIGNFFLVCIEGILLLFTIFYLHRKFLIFLRNDSDCKAVEALDIFKKHRDCKAVALKEYYEHSPIFTCTERSPYFRETTH